jgi:hypothetical protein
VQEASVVDLQKKPTEALGIPFWKLHHACEDGDQAFVFIDGREMYGKGEAVFSPENPNVLPHSIEPVT